MEYLFLIPTLFFSWLFSVGILAVIYALSLMFTGKVLELDEEQSELLFFFKKFRKHFLHLSMAGPLILIIYWIMYETPLT